MTWGLMTNSSHSLIPYRNNPSSAKTPFWAVLLHSWALVDLLSLQHPPPLLKILLPWLPFRHCLYFREGEGEGFLLLSHSGPLSVLLKSCQFFFRSVKAGFTENSLASPRLYVMNSKANMGSVLVFWFIRKTFPKPSVTSFLAFIMQGGHMCLWGVCTYGSHWAEWLQTGCVLS